MPRVSKCDKLPEHERLRLVGQIGEGVPWETLEVEFGIASSSIHQWAARNGYGRSPTASKRKMVEDLLSKPEKPETEIETGKSPVSTGNPDVDAAAREDERDMRLGLQAARLALQVSAIGLKEMREAKIADPKATKTWSECIAINVATIRKIRNLDDPKPEASSDLAALAADARRRLGV